MLRILGVLVVIVAMMMAVSMLKRKTEKQLFRQVLWLLFAVYACGNLYFTLFSRGMGGETQLNLTPFQTYLRLFEEPISGTTSVSGLAAVMMGGLLPVEGLILNTLLYYPLGYLLPILFPNLRPKHVILIGCLCSIATEATQYILKMGCCETDDVIHNTLGAVIGVWVWALQYKRFNRKEVSE